MPCSLSCQPILNNKSDHDMRDRKREGRALRDEGAVRILVHTRTHACTHALQLNKSAPRVDAAADALVVKKAWKCVGLLALQGDGCVLHAAAAASHHA
jgi:hypothetical protein